MMLGKKKRLGNLRKSSAVAVCLTVISIIIACILGSFQTRNANNISAREDFRLNNRYEVSLVEEQLLQFNQGVLTYLIGVANVGDATWDYNNAEKIGFWLESSFSADWVIVMGNKSINCLDNLSSQENFKCFVSLPVVENGDVVDVSVQLQPSIVRNLSSGIESNIISGGTISMKVGCQDNAGCMLGESLNIEIEPGLISVALINNTKEKNPIMNVAKEYFSSLNSVGLVKAGNGGDTRDQPKVVIYSHLLNSDLVFGFKDKLSNLDGSPQPPILKSSSDYLTEWDSGAIQPDTNASLKNCELLIEWGVNGKIPLVTACRNLGERADVVVVISY